MDFFRVEIGFGFFWKDFSGDLWVVCKWDWDDDLKFMDPLINQFLNNFRKPQIPF